MKILKYLIGLLMFSVYIAIGVLLLSAVTTFIIHLRHLFGDEVLFWLILITTIIALYTLLEYDGL